MIILASFGVIAVLYFITQWVYRRYWDKNLTVDASLPAQDVYEGDVATITETIINDKFLPLPVLETFFSLERGLRYKSGENAVVTDKQYRRDVFAVGMKRKIRRTFDVTCEKRGYYTLETIEMMSSDLFLRQKFLGKRDVYSSFHVYPRKVRSDEIKLPYQSIMGELLVRKKMYSDPFSFGGMRDYVNTDPMNSINWKASAKAQNLVVNVYDSSNDQKVLLLLDTAQGEMGHGELLKEESICIVAALAERLLLQGVAVTILGNGCDICTKEQVSLISLKGQGVLLMKEHLARLHLGNEVPIATRFGEIPSDVFVVLVSKNQELQHSIQTQLEDFLWIVPYKEHRPSLNLPAGRYLPWEYKTGNLT